MVELQAEVDRLKEALEGEQKHALRERKLAVQAEAGIERLKIRIDNLNYLWEQCHTDARKMIEMWMKKAKEAEAEVCRLRKDAEVFLPAGPASAAGGVIGEV